MPNASDPRPKTLDAASIEAIATAVGALMPSVLTQTTRAYDWANGQRIAVGVANAQSAALPAGEVMLATKERCFVTFDAADPVAAATAGSIPLEAGEKLHVQIPDGGGKIGVIRDTADGYLYILPVDAG